MNTRWNCQVSPTLKQHLCPLDSMDSKDTHTVSVIDLPNMFNTINTKWWGWSNRGDQFNKQWRQSHDSRHESIMKHRSICKWRVSHPVMTRPDRCDALYTCTTESGISSVPKSVTFFHGVAICQKLVINCRDSHENSMYILLIDIPLFMILISHSNLTPTVGEMSATFPTKI